MEMTTICKRDDIAASATDCAMHARNIWVVGAPKNTERPTIHESRHTASVRVTLKPRRRLFITESKHWNK